MKNLYLTSLLFSFFISSNIYAVDTKYGIVPDEYESTAGHSLGLGNSGTVAAGGLSSVRLNPAMLSIEKQYRISAGYHWPSAGRAYYQAGVVDSSTSEIAAGLNYTSSQEDFEAYDAEKTVSPFEEEQIFAEEEEDVEVSPFDSPIRKRVTLAAAGRVQNIAIGVSGQHVEATSLSGKTIKGQTFGFGLAGLLSPTIRFGASIENLGNKKVVNYPLGFTEQALLT